MPDDHEDRFRRREAIMEGLARMLAAQHVMHQEQQEMNRQQVVIHQDVKTTLARIETILARRIPHGENGRDA